MSIHRSILGHRNLAKRAKKGIRALHAPDGHTRGMHGVYTGMHGHACLALLRAGIIGYHWVRCQTFQRGVKRSINVARRHVPSTRQRRMVGVRCQALRRGAKRRDPMESIKQYSG